MTIWWARWAKRSRALLARMGSSKRATHSSTARLLVILWNHGVKLLRGRRRGWIVSKGVDGLISRGVGPAGVGVSASRVRSVNGRPRRATRGHPYEASVAT